MVIVCAGRAIAAAQSTKFIMGGSQEDKYDHPTQKPLELMRRPILNHTKRGELVYEPFLGSGTTLAAAEVTGRVCCGMELEPKYVDVAVQRWQGLAGKEAVLEGDGRSFEQIANRATGRPPEPDVTSFLSARNRKGGTRLPLPGAALGRLRGTVRQVSGGNGDARRSAAKGTASSRAMASAAVSRAGWATLRPGGRVWCADAAANCGRARSLRGAPMRRRDSRV